MVYALATAWPRLLAPVLGAFALTACSTTVPNGEQPPREQTKLQISIKASDEVNLPIRTREFPSNQVLSEKRAQAVAQALMAAGVAPGRVVVEGRGDSQPLADNATAAGRARNRRVDIVVTQAEHGSAPAATTAGAPTTKPGQ